MPYKRGDISNKMDYAKESLRLHEEWKGKIEVVSTVPVESKRTCRWPIPRELPNHALKYRKTLTGALTLPDAGIFAWL